MISLRDLPLTLRALLSSFLIVMGIGYLMALSYLFLVDVEPHQQAGEGVVQGISEKYHGSTSGTRLEAALTGTMADKLTAEERDQILQWVRADGQITQSPSGQSNRAFSGVVRPSCSFAPRRER
jgi:hypothetical protein